MREGPRLWGMIICVASLVTGLVFLLGVIRKSYWALAGPVVAAVGGALYVAFWIGRALLTAPAEPPAED